MMMITKACENFLSFDEMNISIEWGILGQLWEHLTIARELLFLDVRS